MGSWNPTFLVASFWASQAHCCRYSIGILSVNGSNELTPLNLTNVAPLWIGHLPTRDICVTPLMARTCPSMTNNIVPLLHLTWLLRPALLSSLRSWRFISDVIMKHLASNPMIALTCLAHTFPIWCPTAPDQASEDDGATMPVHT
jgi:hypothetical protein